MDERDRSTEDHGALVRSIALRIQAQFDLHGDLDDLVAAGFAGLVEARTRFDPARGVMFSTFAYYRIRGAMIDYVRKSARLSRRAYARVKLAEASDHIAEPIAEARAADPNARKDPARTVEALDDALGKLTTSYLLSCVGQGEDDAPATPEALLADGQVASRLRAFVETLPERERALVVGHYFEGRRFDEVAAELGVSKSWASRMHTKALERLREALGDD